MTIEALQQRLGYVFANPSLLRQALTHRSHGHHNNERLEFLGDSVLNCAVSSLLFERFGKLDEGDLSRLRANLVKQQSLYEIAQKLDISPNLLLGEGELKSGGFRRPSILGDTLEAILGAIYLDGGFPAAQGVIERLYVPVLKAVDPKTLGKDAKTLLQEHLQGRKIPLPVYSVVATHGAAHNQLFEVECAIPKLDIQVLGSGGSRRAAEQAAAKLALDRAIGLMPASGRRARAKAADKASVVPMPAPAPETVEVVRPARGGAAVSASMPSASPAAVPTVSTEPSHAEAAHSPEGRDDRPRSAERAEQGDPSDQGGVPMGDRPSGEGEAPEVDTAGNGSSSGHNGHHLDAGDDARALIDPMPAPERARPTQRSA